MAHGLQNVVGEQDQARSPAKPAEHRPGRGSTLKSSRRGETMLKKIRKVRRTLVPFYRSAIIAFLWANRRDVARWGRFVRRASSRNMRPTKQDLMLEARVRASLSSDPLLRQDPSIRDVRVRDGVVVLETPREWHNKSLAVTRLSQVKGVESVHTAADANEQNWLDVDLAEAPLSAAPL
jgi:hypothetical protein